MPEVSIILPTYNRAKMLPRAIQSVLSQTFANFELIIVDDGSSDNTEEVVKGFKDNRIKYIKNKENKGAAAARNIGIKSAKGKYIAFQDSDDEWLQEKLQKQIDIFNQTSFMVGIVYSDMIWAEKGCKEKIFYSPHIMPKDGIIYEKALRGGLRDIGLQSVLIRKECFKKAGLFDERLPLWIDKELFIRISKYYCFYHIAEPLVKYHISVDSISRKFNNLIFARELILRKYINDIKKDNKAWAYHLYKIGNLLYAQGDRRRGIKYLLQSLKKDPFNVKIWLFLCLLVVGSRLYFNLIYNKLKSSK